MIPLQVTLEGFMSYRDAQTLRFDGAALWLLCGRNGAGKSTVFDAIKYALFGTHRAGSQGADALIHHEKSALRVAFDFGSGAQTWRVVRTRSRKGRPSVQALQLDENGAQAVPETDMEDGFRAWLGKTLGLSEETFVASTLLQQGKSDVLLEAAPARRHEMLLQIVDLSAYERLSERAKKRRDESQLRAQELERRLQTLLEIAPETLEELSARAAESRSQLDALGARRDALLPLAAHAATWARLQLRLRDLKAELETLHALEADAARIEADAARLRELETALPLLESARELGLRLQEAAQREADAQTRIREAQTQGDEAEIRLSKARDGLASLETQLATLRRERDTATATQLRLSPLLTRLTEAARARAELGRVDAALEALGPALDSEIARIEYQTDIAREAERAAPVLRRLLLLRDQITALQTARDEAVSAAQRAAAEVAAEQKTRVRADAAVRDATAQYEAARGAQAKTQAAHEASQAALQRFAEVEGEARCGFCGSELTPQHRAQEHARLHQELARCEAELDTAARAADEAQSARDATQHAAESCGRAEREAETRARDTQTALRENTETAARLQRETEAARAELPSAWDSDEAESPASLARTLKVAGQLGALQTQLSALQKQRGEREVLLRQRAASAGQLQVAERELGDEAGEDAAALRDELREAAAAAARAVAALEQLEPVRATTEHERSQSERDAAAARDAITKAQLARATAATQRAESERAASESRLQVPASWREAWDAARAGADISPQRDERETLCRADVFAALQRLQEARTRAGELRRARDAAQVEAAIIPAEARRPVAEVEAEIAEVRAELERVGAEHHAVERELSEAETARAARLSGEDEARAAAQSRDLHHELAEALGRDGLQRRLLLEAEDAIVENANGVLDRLSGGTLRLETRRDAGSGRQKALDLVAYDGAGGPDAPPMPVAFLSGSQKFRAAVALAIGIGNYATHGARRVESVIIDEGFGSLDAQGRGAMIEELHALGDILKRVIVVSHQEEFAQAFPNRYLIVNESGTSRARLQSGE